MPVEVVNAAIPFVDVLSYLATDGDDAFDGY